MVDNRTYAPFHQHFIVARMDLDVDGTDNTVYQTETEIVPIGPDNPYGLSLRQVNTPLRTEQEAKGDMNFATQRTWKVVNDNNTTGIGAHPAYKLVPGRRSCRCSIPPGGPGPVQGYRAQRLGDAQLARRALARRRIRQPGRSGDGPA